MKCSQNRAALGYILDSRGLFEYNRGINPTRKGRSSDMTGYRKIDMEHWPRREHYAYYTQKLKIEYSITARVQVDRFLHFCHEKGYRFYPALICVVTGVMNQLENFRMFRNGEGELCVWDHVVPNYTFFHQDDKTFSDCWSEPSDDFDTFYHTITADMDRYRDVKGIKVRPDQPANFYCISCDPWTDFTGFSSRLTNGEPQFFPIVTIGRYVEEQGKTTMSVGLMAAHAVCDGYHAGLFFTALQKALDEIGQ